MTDMTKPENPRRPEDLPEISPADGPVPIGADEVLEFGAGWDEAAPDGSMLGRARRAAKKVTGDADDADADAFAVTYTRGDPKKYAGLANTDPYHNEREGAGSITTTGDNLTGEGDGDDETITIRLALVPKRVDRILVTVGAFKKGSDQRKIRNLVVTIYNSTDGIQTPMAFVEPSLLRPKRMLAIGVLERAGDGWTFRVVDASFDIEPGNLDSLLIKSAGVANRPA